MNGDGLSSPGIPVQLTDAVRNGAIVVSVIPFRLPLGEWARRLQSPREIVE
jgi:hypothetical protein